MKHAGQAALDQLESTLEAMRALPGLTEKGRGVFYRKSRAFLHFHEDPEGLFADLRDVAGEDFDRFDVTQSSEALLAATRDRLAT